jgi:hypothetical protein
MGVNFSKFSERYKKIDEHTVSAPTYEISAADKSVAHDHIINRLPNLFPG